MSRPLIQRRIDELETMFATEQGDPVALHLLENELSFRSVPRAATVLAKVKRAMNGDTPPAANQNAGADFAVPVRAQTSTTKQNLKVSVYPTRLMTHEDALKVLEIKSAASWDDIEAGRRRTVDCARPDNLEGFSEKQRSSLKEEASRANAAYLTILQRRKA